MSNLIKSIFTLLIGAVAFTLAGLSAQAEGTRTVLYSFLPTPTNSDGANPASNLIQGQDKNFYGTTAGGGSPTGNLGTIFKMDATGTVTILHSFGDGTVTNDGAQPEGALFQAKDGTFYGTTYAGGAAGLGTIFKMTPTGTVTILHSFTASTAPDDGAHPLAGLVLGKDGLLYGTTEAGGIRNGGTVYRISPSGYFRVLHSFSDDGKDGYLPQTALTFGPDGDLYGTTTQGGTTSSGTIFKITTAGVLTIIHNFSTGLVPGDGVYPLGALTDGLDGYFYGTTFQGGSKNEGTVYRVTPAGAVTILHNFGDGTVTQDGLEPEAGLFLGTDGDLYGTTSTGGDTSAFGVLFKITPGGTETILHFFRNGADGETPVATVIEGADDNFYGTTSEGGSAKAGIAYQYTPSGSYTVEHSFRKFVVHNDGKNPTSGLTLGMDGNYYGVTSQSLVASPNNRNGTIYKITPNGVETVLYFFGSTPGDGSEPNGPLVQAPDGTFYGTTYGGGAYFLGTFFKMTPAGKVTTLYSFGKGSDGGNPIGDIVLDPDGNFYGLTANAFSGNGGGSTGSSFFKITPSGAETVLHRLPDNTVSRVNGVIRGSDDNYYGTSMVGGSAEGGTFFKLTKAGGSTLYSFGPEGFSVPQGNLIEGADHNFYGAALDGATSQGAIFKVTPVGVMSTVHDFENTPAVSDGSAPTGNLIQVADGNFCGVTYAGGSSGNGTIFEVSPSGTETILSNFDDGAIPQDGRIRPVGWSRDRTTRFMA